MAKAVRKYFYYNSTFTAPGGVKYVNLYGIRNPPKFYNTDTSAPAMFMVDSGSRGWAWGNNNNDSIGDGTGTNRSSPALILGGLSFAALYTNLTTTYGLTTSGVAYGWGLNSSGQVGDGTATTRSSPALVVGGLIFQRLITTNVASFCMGLTPNGTLYSWGLNNDGQLGVGDTTNRSSPTAVAGGLVFADVWSGNDSVVGITPAGVAYAWGINTKGEVGDGTTTARSSPTAVVGGLTFSRVISTNDSTVNATFGITTSGAAYAWGSNVHGLLGVGDTTARSSPVAVLGGLTFSGVYGDPFNGNGTVGFLTTTGSAYMAGINNFGQLGDGTTTPKSSPVAVLGGLTFKQIYVGGSYSYGLTPAGAAYAWGFNGDGELGDGTVTPRSSPVAVVGGLNFIALSERGSGNQAGITPTGMMYSWGINGSGQLGDGTTTPRSSPVAVLGGLAFNLAITESMKKVTVVPGTSYAVNVQQYNGQFGAETLGAGPFDYMIVEYFI